MNKKYSKKSIRMFYCLLLAPAFLWGILTLLGATKTLDYDTGEKRNKHSISEDTSLGNLTSELELYINDRVPFRSVMLSMNSKLNWFLELPYSKGIQPGLIALANSSMQENNDQSKETAVEETVAEVSDTQPETEEIQTTDETADSKEETIDPNDPKNQPGYFPYIELSPNVIQGKDGWLFMKEEISDYMGEIVPDEQYLASIAKDMGALKAICDSKGQELYFLALPNKSTIYPEYMPTIPKDEYCALQKLEDYLHAHSDVHFEFIDQEMLAAKQYGQLYYYNDSHWNGRGALAGVAALHKILGIDEIDQGSLEAVEGREQIGDLITYSGLPAENFVKENTVDYYYKQDVQIGLVQGQTDTIDEFVSDAPDGRTLVIVGDSYRHNMMPYLTKDFAHTYWINNEVLTPDCRAILESADIIVVEDVERTYFAYLRATEAISKLIEIMK